MTDESLLEGQQTESVSDERHFTQHEVNEIIGREKAAARRRGHEEAYEEIRKRSVPATQTETLNYQDTGRIDLDKEIEARVAKSLETMAETYSKKEAEYEAAKQVKAFQEKLGSEPFSPEVKSILDSNEYRVDQLRSVVPLLTEAENTREVFEHLVTHPAKMAILGNIVNGQGLRAARVELKRISEGLQKNKEKDLNVANEPLPQIKSDSRGISSSKDFNARDFLKRNGLI
jgi:hypothetical protein